jgi:hypothetical protein
MRLILRLLLFVHAAVNWDHHPACYVLAQKKREAGEEKPML